ncbi:flavo protein [Westerdykella ornata]|uniref:Flavo protein n=1 Tax=Westerdykella ornata TaxID=318751 RepID=A0A6A6JT02_WESOR|nr:flavo protein [Westerdykella ornata]KAF2279741.1 flavo protein [Westerdykella ornata]
MLGATELVRPHSFSCSTSTTTRGTINIQTHLYIGTSPRILFDAVGTSRNPLLSLDSQVMEPRRTLNVLVAVADSTSAQHVGRSIVDLLKQHHNVALRVLVNIGASLEAYPNGAPYGFPEAYSCYTSHHASNIGIETNSTDEGLVAGQCAWADLLVLAPIDAEDIARMLHGFTHNMHLRILRSWDVSKKILLIPCMSALMWENPMSRKQISKIRRKWNWIRVLPPYLWTPSSFTGREYQPWEGEKAFHDSIQTQIDLMAVGNRTLALPAAHMPTLTPTRSKGAYLPPELWSMILEYTGDWELAVTLNVATNLPVPPEWRQAASAEGPQTPMQVLEWTLLTGRYADIKQQFDVQKPTRISLLCIELIMRFGMVPVLQHLENHHKGLFWDTFGHAFLPHKASVFGRPEILEYWRTSPMFLTKEYSVEAMDNASRSGSVQVLDWWYHSGLPLRYTEAALEQASSQGRIDVLRWWKQHSRYRDQPSTLPPPGLAEGGHEGEGGDDLSLKVGKSIIYATQAGSLASIHFWVESGIPFSHEEAVAKVASTHGHTHILDYWRQLRGEKMLYDNQVLAGATKMGRTDVLEWWKRSGLRVEYKTCDIEEALEDGVGGDAGKSVRKWWARNGLNLGVGTSEWMKVKVLGS